MDSNEPSSENEKINKENVKEISQLTHLTNPNENGTIINSLEATPGTRNSSELCDGLEEGQTWEDIKPVPGDQTDSSGIPPDPPLRKKRWLKRLIFLFCLLAFGAIGLTQAPSASIVCEGCHEMKPEIATWKVSSHSKIACIKCHTEINTEHFFQLIHFTKKYYLPIQVKKPVPESICKNCHSGNRAITPRGDLIVPHQKHDKEGITCTECHIGVAHGAIAERQETIDGDFSRWTDVTARQNMSWQYKTINMLECMTCHKERNGPQDCEACHSKIVPPPSHLPKEWVQNGIHGQDAIKDLDSCNECHSYSMNLVRVQNPDKVIAYARSNSFCVNCHAKKPESHNIQPFLHGARATQDPIDCMVCHDKASTKKTTVATKRTVCISCHNKKHTTPQFHPVPIGTAPVASCYRCHPQKSCVKCHK